MYSQDHLMRAPQNDLPRAAAAMRVGINRTPRQHSSHRLGLRLWTLLHAQSLLNGPALAVHAPSHSWKTTTAASGLQEDAKQ